MKQWIEKLYTWDSWLEHSRLMMPGSKEENYLTRNNFLLFGTCLWELRYLSLDGSWIGKILVPGYEWCEPRNSPCIWDDMYADLDCHSSVRIGSFDLQVSFYVCWIVWISKMMTPCDNVRVNQIQRTQTTSEYVEKEVTNKIGLSITINIYWPTN